MAVPKQRHTKSRRDRRRANIKLNPVNISSCPKCSKPRLSHTLCENCGTYKGREIINVLAKLDKKERKKREKEMAEQEKEQTAEKPMSMEELSKK